MARPPSSQLRIAVWHRRQGAPARRYTWTRSPAGTVARLAAPTSAGSTVTMRPERAPARSRATRSAQRVGLGVAAQRVGAEARAQPGVGARLP